MGKQRRAKIAKAAYKRGFAWAMTAYFIENKCIGEIRSYTYGSFNPTLSERSFDNGARAAIDKLRVLTGVQGE